LRWWISCTAEYSGQFAVNCLRTKAFEEEQFDDESLLRFFYLRNDFALMSCLSWLFFLVLCGILPKVAEVWNDQILICFQVIIVISWEFSYSAR
jgi:hypothetical protein